VRVNDTIEKCVKEERERKQKDEKRKPKKKRKLVKDK